MSLWDKAAEHYGGIDSLAYQERKPMSNFQEKDQSGTLFTNSRKERDAQPDWTGKAIVNGVPVYVSGWNKDGRISLAFKNRQEGALGKKDAPDTRPDESDVPF